MTKLGSAFRPSPDYFWRELEWHFPDPDRRDVIWLKFGAWMRVVEILPPNLGGFSQSDQMFEVLKFNSQIRSFGKRWPMYFHERRRRTTDYTAGQFPCAAGSLIDHEQGFGFRAGVLHESRYFIVLIYQPPSGMMSRIQTLLTKDETAKESMDYQREMEKFITRTDGLVAGMRWMRWTKILEGDDLANYLSPFVSTKRHSRRMPPFTADLAGHLTSQGFIGGMYPSIGSTYVDPQTGEVLDSTEEFIRVVSLTDFPDFTHPNILDAMSEIEGEYDRIHRWFPFERQQADKELREFWRQYYRHRKPMLEQAIESFTKVESPIINHEMVRKVEEITAMNNDLAEGLVSVGKFGTTFIVRDPVARRAYERAKEIHEKFVALGFEPEIEEINAAEAYLGAIPGNIFHDINRPGVNSAVVSTMVPLSGIYPGPAVNENHLKKYGHGAPLAYCRSRGTSRRRITLFKGDVGNRAIIGDTGGGKTFLMNFLGSQSLRYPKARVIQYGRKNGGLIAALCHGGSVYNPLRVEGSAVQPLRHLHEDARWAQSWVLNYLSTKDAALVRDPSVEDEVWKALEVMRDRLNPNQRTITAFRSMVQHPWVRAATKSISREGPFGHLFDGVQSLTIDPVWQYFELDVLTNHKEIAGPMMSCLINEAKRLFLKGGQVELAFDEMWMLEGVYLDEIEAFMRLVRTHGAHVALATQSAADLATHKGVITGNCPFTFYVPGRSAKDQTGIRHLSNMGLQMHHINWLANAREKADYLLQEPDGVELINFMAGPAARAICMALDQEEHFSMIERASTHPHSFLAGWLLECKLPEQAQWVMRYDGQGSGNPAAEIMRHAVAAE